MHICNSRPVEAADAGREDEGDGRALRSARRRKPAVRARSWSATLDSGGVESRHAHSQCEGLRPRADSSSGKPGGIARCGAADMQGSHSEPRRSSDRPAVIISASRECGMADPIIVVSTSTTPGVDGQTTTVPGDQFLSGAGSPGPGAPKTSRTSKVSHRSLISPSGISHEVLAKTHKGSCQWRLGDHFGSSDKRPETHRSATLLRVALPASKDKRPLLPSPFRPALRVSENNPRRP